MKKIGAILTILFFYCFSLYAQNIPCSSENLDDYGVFEKLTKEVKEYRKGRIVTMDKFLELSKEKNTIILDIRSDSMYKRKHIKGSIHLDFSNFSLPSLENLIPSLDTKILIYCNNNFYGDNVNFMSKASQLDLFFAKEPKLPLSIPTYITLYGYGYKNLYQLSETVSVFDKRIQFEGTAVKK